MNIIVLNKNNISLNKMNIFTDVVFNNFINIANNSSLNHNKKEIHNILTSNDVQIYLILVNNKIAAYLIGKIIFLNDGRHVLYIYYLYTSIYFRNKGYASVLLNVANSISNKHNLDGIVLTSNTYDKQIYNFYLKKGFMPDQILRTYGQYDVLFK
jgi:hypothetical protein